MANKNIKGKIKIASTITTIAYLEVSVDNGNTFEIIDQMTIPPNEIATIYDFSNYATVDIDNTNLQIRIRTVKQTTTSTSTTSTTLNSTTSTTTSTTSSTSTTTTLAPVIVNAGNDQYLDENISTTNFYGTVVTPSGVTITSYTWSVVTSGVIGVSFSNPNSINTGVSGIPVASRTTFRLTVVDNLGRTFFNDIDVSVAAPSVMYSSGGYLDNLYDSDNPNLRTWVYLPQGYDALKPDGFPLILFLHGAGENGDQNNDDINALLVTTAGLPYFLYNKVYPMNCIVVMPQLHTGMWNLSSAQKALNWAIAGYNVDQNKVYSTGPSSGGGGTFEITYGNPTLFSGGIPSNATANSVGILGNGDIVKNVPYLMVHSYNDTQVPPFSNGSTIDDLNSILAANPKGIYPPLILMAWETGHGMDSWNYYIYDKTRAPFNFEDFLLLHTKNLITTCNNYVVKAEQTLEFIDWSKAMMLINNLSPSTDKDNLVNRLIMVIYNMTTGKNHKYFMVNLGSNPTFNTYSINNVNSSADNYSINNLTDVLGGSSSIGFTVVTNPAGITNTNMNHNYMGMSGDMFSNSFLVTNSQPAQWKFTGLNPAKYYDVIFYHSNTSNQMYSTTNITGTKTEIFGSQAQSRMEGFNTMFTTDHYNILPNSSGEMIINVSAMRFNNNAYQGNTVAILLKEKTTVANSRSNFGKFNCTATLAAAHPDWGTLYGDPTVSICKAADPVSGWEINTVGTSTTYWQKYYSFYANDQEANAGTYNPYIPEIVGRSARINSDIYFNYTTPNYNLEITGTPGMGLPAGKYNLKLFASTNGTWANTIFMVKMGKSNGYEQNTLEVASNYLNMVSFTGTIKDGETIKIGTFMPYIYGVSFINAIILEKVA